MSRDVEYEPVVVYLTQRQLEEALFMEDEVKDNDKM